jgi:PBP1b-binding outer membrane lipoprotein LpoB
MVRKTSWIGCALLGLALLVAGCGNAQKEATEAAINAAQAALTAAQTEAAKYVPDQLQAAQTALQSARDALAKGDYGTALSAAQDAANKAKDLAAAAAAKKAEWTQEWSNLSTTTPKTLDDVKNKLNAYSHGAHMPAGMDKQKLADAKVQYDQLRQTWSDATSAAAQGNLGDAMAKAATVKDALAKLVELLGIKS